MNYIKPEDIKAYVEQNPQGIAGMSEELATMANHFAELIVRECIEVSQVGSITADKLKQHFGVES